MNNLNKDFLEYQESFELKPLGFNEACFAFYQVEYHENSPIMVDDDKQYLISGFRTCRNSEIPNHYISAPTYSQAFRWFREKHNLKSWIQEHTSDTFIYEIRPHVLSDYKQGETYVYTNYEETELACLKKLIEIVKNGK